MADASIALNRFGLGARPDESVPADPKGWLKRQLAEFEPKPAAFAAVPTRTKVAGEDRKSVVISVLLTLRRWYRHNFVTAKAAHGGNLTQR